MQVTNASAQASYTPAATPNPSVNGNGATNQSAGSPPGSTASTSSASTAASGSSSDVWSSDAVTQALKTVSDNSGSVSLDDQLSAYNVLLNLSTNGPTGGNRLSVLTQFQNTNFLKEVSVAQNTYGDNQISADRSAVAVQKKILGAFNELTSRQQYILVNQLNNFETNGIYGSGKTVSGVDGYRQMLQSQLTQFQAEASQTQPTPSVKVTLSSSAQAALSKTPLSASNTSPTTTQADAAKSSAERALKTLTSKSTIDSKSAAALSILGNAAAARATAETKASTLNPISSTPSETNKQAQSKFEGALVFTSA